MISGMTLPANVLTEADAAHREAQALLARARDGEQGIVVGVEDELARLDAATVDDGAQAV
jgi:hypothetical protein